MDKTMGAPRFPFIYSFLSEAYIESNQEEKALEILESEDLIGSKELRSDLAQAYYTNKGLCYRRLEQYDKAEVCLLKAHEMNLKEENPEQLAISSIGLANHYYELYEDSIAKMYFIRGLDYSLETDNWELIRDATLNLAVVEENAGNFQQSLNYRKNYEALVDSIWNQTKIWEIAENEKESEIRLKEKELDLLEREKDIQNKEILAKNKQQSILVLFVLTLLSFLIISLLFFLRSHKRNKIIERQRKELDELNQTKNRILSIVAHDLKSPIYNIAETTKKIVQEHEATPNSQRISSLLKTNQSLSNKTYGLIENLLNWALEQSDQYYFHLERIPLKRITDQVVYNFIPIIESKNLELSCEISEDIYLSADTNSLKIILRNLIDNAIKYTEPSGKIEIKASRSGQGYCELVIGDTGIGMRSEICENVLKPHFFSRERDTDGKIGTGLGLRLCSSLIKRNNGELHIMSKMGKGTKVQLKFLLN